MQSASRPSRPPPRRGTIRAYVESRLEAAGGRASIGDLVREVHERFPFKCAGWSYVRGVALRWHEDRIPDGETIAVSIEGLTRETSREWKAARLSPRMAALLRQLRDGEWHSWSTAGDAWTNHAIAALSKRRLVNSSSTGHTVQAIATDAGLALLEGSPEW